MNVAHTCGSMLQQRMQMSLSYSMECFVHPGHTSSCNMRANTTTDLRLHTYAVIMVAQLLACELDHQLLS
jgi:hypothetical protein